MMFYTKFGLNWPISSEEEFIYIYIFRQYIFVIISPWKRTWPFLWTNWNPHHQRMLCAKFGWNRLVGSGENIFLNSVKVFKLFRNYFPLEKGVAFYFNKHESRLPKKALCQAWLKLAKWFSRFFISSMYFLLFPNYLL